jgi:hypothetical protein
MKLYRSSVLVLLFAVGTRADTILIGAAGAYGVLGEAGVTNTGSSVIYGDVGGSAGTPAVIGFPPGLVVAPATILTGSATVFSNATTAYTTAQGTAGASDLTGDTLGVGLANGLVAGVYKFTNSVSLDGTLILDAEGNNDASWIFQIGSSLNTASGSTVEVINAGAGPFTGSITWAVGSAATLGTTTTFEGTILSEAGSVLDTGATIGCGRVISLGDSVTLNDNVITPGSCEVTGGSSVPEPGSLTLLSAGLLAVVLLRIFRRAAPRPIQKMAS